MQGSGANAPTDEIMSGRADIAPIDTAAWVDMAKKIPGLIAFPKGDACLTNGEFPTEVGMAIVQTFYVQDIIEPKTTRAILIDALDTLDGKRVQRPNRKHGNIPL